MPVNEKFLMKEYVNLLGRWKGNGSGMLDPLNPTKIRAIARGNNEAPYFYVRFTMMLINYEYDFELLWGSMYTI